MKIRERHPDQEANQIAGTAGAAADRVRERKEEAARSSRDVADVQESGEHIRIGLGSVANQELNPTAIAEERRAKVEYLKKLISEGAYSVDSQLLAQKFAEEINFEVALAPAFEGGDGTDDDESEKT